MNIKEAKRQIKDAMVAYFAWDDFGNPLISISRQRPVFLYGAPGIGKTAIMSQIADELGVGLVSYSMTHHTRQSALGLPFISKKNYGGTEYDVSEYTMSEIIASVYDQMEETGLDRGILFLDEINCVSETLTPAMLQFLQFKVFGRHRVPDGWIVVTAGNPPEYNRSVREFDIVTWDRLKRVDVEPDFDAWKEYAYHIGVHPAVMTYLELKPSDFYKVETTVSGKSFVTARGWDDLSQMMLVYEQQGLVVDALLIGQYLQDRKIAKDFGIYYELFKKYREEYRVDDILAGVVSEDIKERVRNSPFDERVSLLGLLINRVNEEMRDTMKTDAFVQHLHEILKAEKDQLTGDHAVEVLQRIHGEQLSDFEAMCKVAGGMGSRQIMLNRVVAFFDERLAAVKLQEKDAANFACIEAAFKQEVSRLQEEAESSKRHLDTMFEFVEEVFRKGQELSLVVTELSISEDSMRFIGEYGCDKYFEHNRDLMLHDRQKELEERLETLQQSGSIAEDFLGALGGKEIASTNVVICGVGETELALMGLCLEKGAKSVVMCDADQAAALEIVREYVQGLAVNPTVSKLSGTCHIRIEGQFCGVTNYGVVDGYLDKVDILVNPASHPIRQESITPRSTVINL